MSVTETEVDSKVCSKARAAGTVEARVESTAETEFTVKLSEVKVYCSI